MQLQTPSISHLIGHETTCEQVASDLLGLKRDDNTALKTKLSTFLGERESDEMGLRYDNRGISGDNRQSQELRSAQTQCNLDREITLLYKEKMIELCQLLGINKSAQSIVSNFLKNTKTSA